MTYVLTVAILSASLYGAAAHSCEDGSGIRCVEVQPDTGDWSSEGHGRGATGTALCTPEGQKVYCLLDHSYHNCPSGQEPCCADGSNPFHWHHSHGSTDDDLVCTAAESSSTSSPPASETSTTTESLEDLNSPGDSPDDSSIVLDTADENVEWRKHKMIKGSYLPCMADAYQREFYTDVPQSKGDAHLTFVFRPPEDGCYEMEEYHPGNDSGCARSFPRNALLDVDYCIGLSTTFNINQAINPSQWNKIGSLMFFRGEVGRFTMRSSRTEECDEDMCILVADAFRLTRTGRKCESAAPSPTPESEQSTDQQRGSEEQSPDRGARSPQDQYPDRGPLPKGQSPDRGMLLLDIAANQQGADMDVRLQLQKISQHRRAIEVAIEAHFSYDRVHFDQIRIASGRRLQGRQLESCGRRLQSRELGAGHDHDHDHDHHNVKSFEVDFLAFGGMSFAPGSSEALRSALNRELNKAAAGLQVAAATVSWSGAPNPEAEEEAPGLSGMAIKLILLGSVLLIGASTAGIIACSLYRKLYCDGPSCNIAKAEFDAPTPKDMASNDPKLIAADSEKAVADSKESLKAEDIEAGSISTGEPADYQGCAMDNSSSEGGNNSGDSVTGTGEQPAQINSGDCETGTGEQPVQILKVAV